MFLTAILFGAVFFLFMAFYRQRKWKFLLFKNQGIDGPEPNILMANSVELHTQGQSKQIQEWTKRYGKLFGFYETANTPILVTSDLDFIQKVFVKEFGNFSGRKLFPVGDDPSNEDNISMFLAEGVRWKRLRSIVSPAFSTNKMKNMSPLLTDCIDTMMNVLEENRKKNDGNMNILPIMQGMTMEVIASVAFGIQIQSQQNSEDPFLVACRNIFRNIQPQHMHFLVKIMLTTAVALPEMKSFVRILFLPMRHFFRSAFLKETCISMIKERKKNPIDRPDFLTIMVAAETEAIDHVNEKNFYKNDASQNGDTAAPVLSSIGRQVAKHLTINEMEANSQLFLIAGYETTSNALSYAAYELARHPEIQSRLQAEIDEFAPNDVQPNYTNVQKMQYLDMVLYEALRLYPIAPSVTTRRCLRDTYINGILIKEGVTVLPDILSIHYDPEIWGPTDTTKFDPERFSPEARDSRHPMAFLSFGAGPRNCIGMRFALLEAKLALANILKKYNLRTSDNTEQPLPITEGGTRSPTNGVNICISLRS